MRRAALHYLIAAAAVALAAAITALTERAIVPGTPLVFFVPAVIFAAWLGGLGPGLLASALSSAIACYWDFPPIGSFRVADPADWFRLFLFGMQGVFASVVMEHLHRTRRQSDRLRDSLRRSEGQLRDLMDNAQAVIFIKDADGRYVMTNRHFEALFGSAGMPVVGHSDLELFPPDLAEKYRADDLRVMATNRPLQCEDVARLGDGDHVYLTTKFPLRDPAGACYAVGGFSAEITERQRVERVHALLASIVDSSDDAIVGKGLDGVITSWNAAAERLFGYPAAEAIGRPIALIIPPDRLDEEAEILAQIRRSVGVAHFETVRRRKDGGLLDISLTISPVRDAEGRVIGASKIARDITERKRAEEALARSAERLEALSRQLLRSQEEERRRIARELHDEIGGSLTALKISLQDAARGRGPAGALLEEGTSIVDLILGQVRGMALDLRPSILDDLGLVPALDWFVARHSQRTGLEGRMFADPEVIRADPEIETVCFRIAQEALTNVARHAWATRFSVELLQHGEGITLVVRDDGIGFDPDLARESARWASVGLTGMRERVELVGGRIVFVSRPGSGAEVQVDLPNAPSVALTGPNQESPR